jgi:hypothetical protein
MVQARRWSLWVSFVLVLGACQRDSAAIPKTAVAPADTAPRAPDSIPDETPDSVIATPPDSMTMLLALLPAPKRLKLEGEAAALADRAVFTPRTQRWFVARMIDSALLLDIGRIDGGVGGSESSQAAFADMVASRSPLQVGATLSAHAGDAASDARITGFRLVGRRIVAELQTTATDTARRAFPVEWRGATPAAMQVRTPQSTQCSTTDVDAVERAIANYGAGSDNVLTVLRGCFGDFRALVVIRPREITPETTERVVLIRQNGTTRSGKLRDLSYPLHELQHVLDVNGDGTNEIVVRSFRPAMETWAALRMTDSITFTRFASGFTIEKR